MPLHFFIQKQYFYQTFMKEGMFHGTINDCNIKKESLQNYEDISPAEYDIY
ncbi:hypothetical protein PcaKH35_19400 [Parageobacillus caldoxylosilyticus]|nr:hypothetical protein PcaKH35_19400 [Parageobacillus caldoxylosilyticus]